MSSLKPSNQSYGYNEAKYQLELNKISEKFLLMHAFKFVVIPAIILALLGCVFPFMQALVPVQESNDCICYFID